MFCLLLFEGHLLQFSKIKRYKEVTKPYVSGFWLEIGSGSRRQKTYVPESTTLDYSIVYFSGGDSTGIF
jgi:hypothetical protein